MKRGPDILGEQKRTRYLIKMVYQYLAKELSLEWKSLWDLTSKSFYP